MDPTATESSETSLFDHQKCIVEATMEMLNATCGIELQPVQDLEPSKGGVIIGIISLVGDVEWALFLGLPSGTAPELAGKFAGFEIPFDSPDMGDAVGELANILAGDVKRRLQVRGVNADISLPSVIRAESLEVLVQTGAEAIKMCYSSPVGTLWTGLGVHTHCGFVA